ncbi:MAG: hypothetical protein ABSF53_19020 [Terracidiphilus sp.]
MAIPSKTRFQSRNRFPSLERVALSFTCLAACLVVLCGSACAQTPKTITVRMLDSKSGILIASSSFLVRMNHLEPVHGDWVRQNDDGTGKLTLPGDAAELSIHATYESATLTYVNCDADKDRGSPEHAPSPDRWYPVAQIVASGIVAPNNCIGKKIPEKLQVIANPGEFVFFVRPMTTIEKFRE